MPNGGIYVGFFLFFAYIADDWVAEERKEKTEDARRLYTYASLGALSPHLDLVVEVLPRRELGQATQQSCCNLVSFINQITNHFTNIRLGNWNSHFNYSSSLSPKAATASSGESGRLETESNPGALPISHSGRCPIQSLAERRSETAT
jgi:hypothetical protein